MSKGVFRKTYSKYEFNFQVVNTHAAATNNVALFTGENDVELWLKGDSFRKTVTSGTGVDMFVELFELEATPTGGTEYLKYLGIPKDRRNGLLQDYLMVLENVVFVANPSGIMLRERSVAEKTSVDRSSDLDLQYSLKRNTWYLFKSTVTSGTDYNVESVLTGEIIIL